jgi:hypothetical protein
MAVSRRRFLQLAAASGAVGLAGAIGYGAECALQPAPYPVSLAPDPLDAPRPEPDAPLLLALNAQSTNPFGRYLAEILRAEGLNAFRVARLDALDPDYLSRFDVVLLSAGPLEADQVGLLQDYVTGGGGLIAMQPDPQLAAILGVSFTGGQAERGYLRVNPDHRAGQGITTDPIQFHSAADVVRLDGAEVVAWLNSDAGTATGAPLVTLHTAGAGKAALWAFDLALSVALTRQGNPAQAHQERDGLEGIRACDMFVDWIDLDRIEIPQADEQQRLLVNLIQQCSRGGPQPRLWYFPVAAGAVLAATGDAHQNVWPSIEGVLARVERHGGRMSIYYTPPTIACAHRIGRKVRWWASDLPVVGDAIGEGFPLPSPARIAVWRERGHEFGMHPFVESGLEQGLNTFWNDFVKYAYGPVSPTVRTHRILWHAWVETARAQSAYGIRMNLDYYHVGPAFLRADGQSVFGHFTGSGLPMKFVDERGAIVNVYQQNTQLVDEHLLDALGGKARLTPDEAIAVSRRLIDLSLKQYPAALAMQSHVDPYEIGGAGAEAAGRWLDGTLEYAAANSVPILPAEQWLAFSEARHDAGFNRLAWDADQSRLTFEVAVAESARVDLEVMLPSQHGERSLRELSVDGVASATGERIVGGMRYATARLPAGEHIVQAHYAS